MDRTVSALIGRRAPALVAVALVAACTSGGGKKEEAKAPGVGRRVLDGKVRAVRPSPDGAWLAVLTHCEEAATPFLPPKTASCDLEVVPAAGGERTRVAAAVPTLPDGLSWGPERLAALSAYDYPAASGTLVEWRPGAAPREIAAGVTFYAFGPGGELGFVAAGELSLAEPGEPPRAIPGTTGAATFELAPVSGARAGVLALVRRRAAVGGDLLAVPASGRARTLAAPVAEYAYARGGERFAFTVVGKDGAELRLSPARLDARPAAIGRAVRDFTFAPAGGALAYVSDAVPGKQGDLHVHAGGQDHLLGKDVGEYRWAAAAPRLVWLEGYDPRVRSGTAGAGGPDLAPRTYGGHVSDVEISADGHHVAFLQHTTRGGYSVDLGLAHLDAAGPPKADTVAAGVFGFAFSPGGKWLVYRTRCTATGDACDVERMPAAGLSAGAKPELVAKGAKSFDLDPRDPDRLLLAWKRGDGDALDLAVWDRGTVTRIDTHVLAGSAQLLPPDGRRVAYAVVETSRAGVYVAEVPAAQGGAAAAGR